MCEFKVGDKVIMSKPLRYRRQYKGEVGVITAIDERRGYVLMIDTMGVGYWWVDSQFELFNPTLENK